MDRLRIVLTRTVGWFGLVSFAFFPLAVVSLIETTVPAVAQNAAKPIAALSNTPVSVKTSRGVVGGLNCYNPNASVEYVQFFDTLAVVSPGVTVPKFFVALTPSTTTSMSLNVSMYAGIQVIAATASGGGSAPGSALPCVVTFQ